MNRYHLGLLTLMSVLLSGLSFFSCEGLLGPSASPSPGASATPTAAATATPSPSATTTAAPTNTPAASLAPGGQIIADHTVVDRYNNIPQSYIDLVKEMWLNVPGESHSQAYRTGLGLLEAQEPLYATDATTATDCNPTPTASNTNGLRASRYFWYGSSAGYNTGESTWFTNAAGIASVKSHLDYYNGASGNIPISAMGFGWCWDMSWRDDAYTSDQTWEDISNGIDPVYRVHWDGSTVGGAHNARWGLDAADTTLTGNSICMQSYLDATKSYADYCASQGYDTKVFYTTGPVDGYGDENGYQRQLKHDFIRSWVEADASRILFDYADILAWNDAGQEYTETWTDDQSTDHSFQMLHPDNGGGSEVGHIGTVGALRLGKALWWMLARIAGWDGVSQ